MSRTSSDEQLNFLLKCVKHSNNGKVDFQAVADECGIVSKGAAAKRYERMMKANGINPNGGALTPEAESPSKPGTTPKKTPAKTPAKRKAKGAAADGDTSETPKKRRGGKALASPKNTKFEEKVLEWNYKRGDKVVVKKEQGLRGDNDPFLTQPGEKANGEDDMFKQFVETAAAAGETVFVKSEYA